MADARKPEPSSRLRAAALPWMGRGRSARRADGLPAAPRPTSRRILSLAAGGVLALGVAIGAAWLAILYMPLPASQVIPRVKAAIQQRLGPEYAVEIADAELHRGGDGVELRLVELAISKVGGGPVVASVPRAELRLDGLGLLGGDVEVRSVHVTSPRLDMRFDDTVDAASKNADLPARVLAAIGDLDRLLGPDGAAGALEEVEVADATILVAPRSRAPLALDGVNLRLSRGPGGAIALTASSARADDRWTTAVTVTSVRADKARVIDVGLENVNLAPYSAPLAEKAGAAPVAGRVSGHLNAEIGGDGKLLAGDGRLDARSLQLSLPGPAAPEPPRQMSLDRVQLALRWDPVGRALLLEPSQIRGHGGQMSFAGSLAAPDKPGKPWLAQLHGTDILLSGESPSDAPLRLDRIEIEARFEPTTGVLEIDKGQILGPTAGAAISGLIRFNGESPAVQLGLVSSPMPASAVKRLWPFFLASSVRGWIVENVSAGRVDSVSLTLDIPVGALAKMGPHDPLPPGSMDLDIRFGDGVLRGRPGMPWIEGAKGKVIATSQRVDVMIDQAYVADPGEEGALSVSNVHFVVPQLGPRYPPATVDLKMDGSLRRALSMVASGAFGRNPLPSQLEIANVSGRIAADVSVKMELDHADAGPPPVINVLADMRDVKIANLFAGRSFEKGAFQLKVADGPPTLTGSGSVRGAPATVSMLEEPAPAGGQARRKLAVTLTADAGDLTRLGLDVSGSLRGAVPLSAELYLDEPSAPMTVTADLAKVGIDGVIPGFVKPAGRAGRLSFKVERGPEKTIVRDFVLESGDRSVRGAIEFGAKGDLIAATLPIYRPAAGDDARVEIDKGRGGVTKVSVQGAALDLKPLMDAYRKKTSDAGGGGGGDAGGGAAKNLDVSAKLGTGLGYGGEAVAGLDLRLGVRDGKVVDADGAGRIGAGAIKLSTGEGGRLNLAGEDAGAALRFADLYGRVDGGAFVLAASLSGGPGVLRIRDFSVRNENALERVRRTTGADSAAPARGGATRFDRLKVDFVQGGGRIAVKEAVVYGPQLGATLSGAVNYASDSVDLVGTFVPVYALNNLFSRVPLFGALLGGGEHGGLLGVTFKVQGRTAAPTITINPMSAVAPGFMRKLFEFRQDGRPDAPAASAPAEPTER